MAAGRYALDPEIGRLDLTDHLVDRIVQSAFRQRLVHHASHGLQGIFVGLGMDRRVHVGHHNRGEEEQRFTKRDQMIFRCEY